MVLKKYRISQVRFESFLAHEQNADEFEESMYVPYLAA